MNRFAAALALLDAVAASGARLEQADGARFRLSRPAPDELRDRLKRFTAPVSPEGSLEELVTRAMAGATPAHACDGAPLAETLERARRLSDRYRALVVMVAAPSRAARELLTLSVSLAVGLPVPFAVRFARRGDRVGVECVGTSSRAVYQEALSRGAPVFLIRELVAMAAATAIGRATPQVLDAWIAEKQARPRWVLEHAEAVGIPGGGDPGDVCFGELFDALGAEIVDVETGAV